MINRRIRFVGIFLLLCFIVLFLQLNNIQVRQAPALSKDFSTISQPVSVFNEPRGAIFSSNMQILAESVPSKGPYPWKRVYTSATAAAFSNITGAVDTTARAIEYGIEAAYNNYLQQHSTSSILNQHNETDDVILTVNTQLQEAATAALAAIGQPGSAMVAIDPRNGDILAMAEYPTFNPNLIASTNAKVASAAIKRYTSVPYYEDPIYNIPSFVTRPPGSTFKTITTSAIFDHDPSIAQQNFPVEPTYTFPHSGTPPVVIQNYARELCGGNLATSLADSCDTAYSQIGVELGAQNLGTEARAFGFDRQIPLDLVGSEVATSVFPSTSTIDATPYEGYSAIGQFDDSASTLQMALVVAGLANGGKIMVPHLVSRIISGSGQVAYQYHPHVWLKATSASTAKKVRTLMLGVTQKPGATAYSLFQSYYSQGLPAIAAKTGTAEPQKNVCGTYNWLVSFGPAGAGQTPRIAIATMVPIPTNSLSCQTNPTGAAVAGPPELSVLEQALRMNLP
jgi:peptidoglycan glycosyltransferase